MEFFGLDVPLWTLLATLAAVLFYIYGTWTFDTWSKQGIKGQKPWILFGSFIHAMKAGGFAMLDQQLRKEFGRISGSYRGRQPILDVADPEFLRLTMIKGFTNMPNRANQEFGNVFDYAMTSLTDDHWRHVRSSLTPTFTSGKLKLMKSRIDVCADRLVENIGEKDGEPFDSKDYMAAYTMDVISSTAFGIEVDSQKNPDHPIMLNANKIMGTKTENGIWKRIISFVRILMFLLLPARILKFLGKIGMSMPEMKSVYYFADVTKQILAERGAEKHAQQKDFVQLCVDKLIDDPSPTDPDTKFDGYGNAWSTKGLTSDQIVANAIIFFLAGFDTTATTLNFTIYELAMCPEVQERAYNEIMDNTASDVATYEELSKMEYLDWVICEAMRIYPAAPRIERLVARETTIEGIRLPANSMVSAMVYAIHHDPEIWPEPEKFDPERFSAENSEGRHQYAWIPFGLGNRNCIGMRLALLEIKIALVKILTNFVLERCEGTPEKPIKYAKNFRMHPQDPIKIRGRRRAAVRED